jgi:hypothetical protein
MIKKINNKKRRSMNATPTLSSNMIQWQGAKEDLKQKQARAKGRAQAGLSLKSYIRRNN